MLYEGCLILGDHNPQHWRDPEVDGKERKRGLIPRNFLRHPLGSYRSITSHELVDMPLIDDVAGRLKELRDGKALLSDIRNRGNPGMKKPIPSRDQNGRGYCHTADTEVLTDRGFVAWSDYNWSDLLGTVNPETHALEFQAPFEKHVYDYDGEMLYSTNKRVDFGVTPDHQMYVRKWDAQKQTLSDSYSFVRADDIGWYAGLLHAPSGHGGTELVELEVPGDRRYDGDDLMALLGLIVSDGYAGGADRTKNLVSFASFREESRARIAALAARLGFKEAPSCKGVWNRWGAGALANWIRLNCYTGPELGSPNKRVPDLIKVASQRQIKIFLDYFDDRNRAASQYYTTSKKLADDIQELHLRIGKRTAIDSRPPRDSSFNGKEIHSRGIFTVTVGETDRLCIDRKKHIEREHYKGPVFCAAVPNHTLVTRRNGTVLVSSNCWQHSGVSATMIVRARDGQPYADLSAYGPACRDKKFADEGGWGAEGVQNLIDWGCPTSKTWPQQGTKQSYNNAATWEEASHYKIDEGWIDLARQDYDRNLTWQQFVTCWLSGHPTVNDYNWWSHSVCGIDPVDGQSVFAKARDEGSGKRVPIKLFEQLWKMDDPVTAGMGCRIWNSWGDSWSENGTGILTPQKAVPDGGVACRTVLLSA